jgi:hypothetical protein
MPTEFRFDDLDLREEPMRFARAESDIVTSNCTQESQRCLTTTNCTASCCTNTCSDICS